MIVGDSYQSSHRVSASNPRMLFPDYNDQHPGIFCLQAFNCNSHNKGARLRIAMVLDTQAHCD